VCGGLIGHCVSPQPWREIDAHGPSLLHSCHPRRDNSNALWPAYVQIYTY